MPRTTTSARRASNSALTAPRVASARAWIGLTASVAVALAAFAFAFHKLDDFDTWWHLAAGRWIAVHRAIPATDTLSFTVRDHPWINLQWGFDLGLYLIHRIGGPVLLCIAGAVAFTATIGLLLRLVSLRVGTSFAALLVLLVVLAAQERVTLRPELLSFLLLVVVLVVIDHGRRHEGRGWWLLVPLMIVWVNVHALFVLGAFAIVCALVGTATPPPRRLLLWGGAALASALINPFGLDGVLFPWTLLSRINGSNPVFQTVGEFGSPFAEGATGVSLLFYKLLLAIGGVLAVAALIAGRRPSRARPGASGVRFDWGGLIFFLGLAVVSATARRNVAVFAIGSAPFLAWCLDIVGASRSGRRLTEIVAATTAVAAVVAAGSAVSGAIYKVDNAPQEFGAGVIEGTFPVRAAAFARAAGLPRALYNDMSAGGYLAWDNPIGGGVFVDGRLEVYDTAFVTAFATALSDQARWQADADRYGIQTAIIFHRFENTRVLAGRLSHDRAWSLVYADEVAAIFVRTAGNDGAIARAASLRAEWDAKTEAWLAAPARKWPYPAGRIEGTRALARFRATVGAPDPAVAAYLTLLELGIPAAEEVDVRVLLARYFAKTGRISQAQEQARGVLAIDPDNTEARALLQSR